MAFFFFSFRTVVGLSVSTGEEFLRLGVSLGFFGSTFFVDSFFTDNFFAAPSFEVSFFSSVSFEERLQQAKMRVKCGCR